MQLMAGQSKQESCSVTQLKRVGQNLGQEEEVGQRQAEREGSPHIRLEKLCE